MRACLWACYHVDTLCRNGYLAARFWDRRFEGAASSPEWETRTLVTNNEVVACKDWAWENRAAVFAARPNTSRRSHWWLLRKPDFVKYVGEESENEKWRDEFSGGAATLELGSSACPDSRNSLRWLQRKANTGLLPGRGGRLAAHPRRSEVSSSGQQLCPPRLWQAVTWPRPATSRKC